MSGLASDVVMNRRAVALALVTLVTFAVFVPLPAAPFSGGIVGQTRGGCTCHNQTESFGMEATLEGLPGSWEPGQVYHLEIGFEGGPSRGPGARAGFDLRASKGEVMVPGDSRLVRVDPGSGEATHTHEGSNTSSWSVDWRAPSEGTGEVAFSLLVNVVNGDGVQGPGDQWGRFEAEVPEGDPGGLGRASEFWIVVGIASVMAIAGLAWYATRGPKVERR